MLFRSDGDDGDDDEGCVDDDDSDDQIVRPVRHLRNVVGSDEDEIGRASCRERV